MMSSLDLNSLRPANIFVLITIFCEVTSDVSELSRGLLHGQLSGYSYPQPQPLPPVTFDDPSPLPPLYLPPVFADETPIFPPSSPAPPPPPIYLPPSYLPPVNNDVLPPIESPLPPIFNDDSVAIPAVPPPSTGLYLPSKSASSPQLKIENMSCTQGVNFRATFKMIGVDVPNLPVVEDSTESCVAFSSGNVFKMELDSFSNMVRCGVRRCKSGKGGDNMCVVLRLPTVQGLRLPEDVTGTLVCIPQEKVVSQTKHVRLGTNKIYQTSKGRSAANGFIATGGTQKDLKTRISVFRKRAGTNVFDQNVQPDSVIQLGEELLLRAAINDDDGWKSSHMGPVLITGLNSKKSALLVNQNGCVNSAMKSICPHQPSRVNNLAMELPFRAFLFQESPQGDEMVISVKMQGCLHSQDCPKSDCQFDSLSNRSKRDLLNSSVHTDKKSVSKDVKNWETELSFRVELATPKNKLFTADNSKEGQDSIVYYFCLSVITVFFLFIFVIFLLCNKKDSK